ncbi:MAG: hypothetical protein FJ405_06920 [Verrucomicrobia bacterium]|nr:hypothetical protein [Verrucomicrobiota bacterium]
MSDSKPSQPPSGKPQGSTEGSTEDHVHGPGFSHDHGPAEPAPDPMPADAGSRALASALASSFAILKVVMVLLVIAFLLSNLKIVGPEERGVILRFGRPVGEGEGVLLSPGAKLAWPYPIDEFQRVAIGRQLQASSTAGWYLTTKPIDPQDQEEPEAMFLDPGRDGYAITADANIVHVRAILNYRITDPARYLFSFKNTPSLITNAINNAILHAAANSSVSNLFTTGLAEFRDNVSVRLQTLVREQQLGVAVDNITADVVAPRQVRRFFDQVLETAASAQAQVTDARTAADLSVRKAESSAKSILFAAAAQRTTDLIQLTNEVQRFKALLSDYQKSPELLKRRYLSELMRRSGPSLNNTFVLRENPRGLPQELRLLLNRDEKLPLENEPAKEEAPADAH